MNRGVYALASGMIASQRWLDLTANNLANASTAGFKQDVLSFGDALVRRLAADGGAGAVVGSLGAGSEIKAEATDLSQGAVTRTGSPLDLALQGPGMFAVRTPDGQTRYTRNGEFARAPDGTLATRQGLAVLDDAGQTITLPDGELNVASDGGLSVNGQPPFARLGLFGGPFAKEGNLFAPVGAAPTAFAPGEEGAPLVVQGAVESSNVSPIAAMTDMIKLGRAVELSQKAVQSQDEMTTRLIQSLDQR